MVKLKTKKADTESIVKYLLIITLVLITIIIVGSLGKSFLAALK
jgi:hypothetical protein